MTVLSIVASPQPGPGKGHRLSTGFRPLDRQPPSTRPGCVSSVPGVALAAALASGLLAGCSPALDWRDARPGDGPLQVLMPCKPASEQRPADVGGATVAFTLSACEASGHTYAVLAGRLPEGADTDAALRGLRLSLAARVGASAVEGTPFAVKGVAPGPESRRLLVRGQRADGRVLVVDAAVLRHQGWVFQASISGPDAAGDAAQTFFEGFRAAP